MMNFTEDAPVKKGSVLLTRMERTPEQSDIPVSANDMCSLAEWPSHARRNQAGGQKKKGRGVLKGFKASKKRSANGSAKLNITFSEKLGGTDRWDLEDTPEIEEKVLKIAKERYRGWRSTLSSTYKAYKTDAARLANLSEDLQPEEWEWMIEYFGTDSKFQVISKITICLLCVKERSQKNVDNRKKQKTKHIIRSKSYSQVSFEKRNLESGEEPDCIALWELTHTNDGTWSNTDSQKVYDQALQEVKNKEAETEGPLSSEQKNNVFQTAYKDTLECKSSQPRGYGYMAKTSTGSEKFRIQIEEQARATAATQERNSQLSQQVNDLEDQLQAERANTQERINLEHAEREQLEERLKEERAERERLLQEERTSRLEFEKNIMAKFVQLSKQMETQQAMTSSPNKTPGSRPTAISSNALIQAAARQSRMFKAIDVMIMRVMPSLMSPLQCPM
ncbi:hypothetical protein CFC21_103318 [Triticum aestivum]|uniref:Uncharacterized protein n=2 Tax=Triticum aestivum TaxID=4565 RepID=A0A3B6SEI6_WHEAT|nr:hypothetical protein CFC21_103318 [Triticum aestivum]